MGARNNNVFTGTKNQAVFTTDAFESRIPHDGSTDENKDTKVTFTPEQQARVDEIVRESMGRAARDLRAEKDTLASEMTTLKSQLQEAQTKLKGATGSKNKEAAAGEVEALKAQIDEVKRAGESTAQELERTRKLLTDKDNEVKTVKASELNTRKHVAIQAAATKNNFVSPDMVAKVTADQVEWDADRSVFVVKGDNGQPRLNSSYEPMTLEQYYAEFASNNQFMVRSDVKGGVGSSEASRSNPQTGKYALEDVFGPKAKPAMANKLAMTNKKEYDRMKIAAREAGLITWG